MIPYEKLSYEATNSSHKIENTKLEELKQIKNLPPMKEYIEILKENRIRIPYFFQNPY